VSLVWPRNRDFQPTHCPDLQGELKHIGTSRLGMPLFYIQYKHVVPMTNLPLEEEDRRRQAVEGGKWVALNPVGSHQGIATSKLKAYINREFIVEERAPTRSRYAVVEYRASAFEADMDITLAL
jgi:hypothetical protein